MARSSTPLPLSSSCAIACSDLVDAGCPIGTVPPQLGQRPDLPRSARSCRDDDVAVQADRSCVSASPAGQQTLGLACKPFAAGRSPSVTSPLWVELCRALA